MFLTLILLVTKWVQGLVNIETRYMYILIGTIIMLLGLGIMGAIIDKSEKKLLSKLENSNKLI